MDSTQRPFRLGRFLAFSWVVLFVWGLFWSLPKHTLGSWFDRLAYLSFFELFISSLSWLFFCLPATLGLYGLLRWRKASPQWQRRLCLLPLLIVMGEMAWRLWPYWGPTSHSRRFAVLTGKPWPAQAKLLSASYFYAFGDSRSAWYFESEPEILEAVLKESEWHQMEAEELKFVNHGTRIPGMDQFDEFRQDSVTLHGWSPDKEATSGPVGSVYLIANGSRNRWCVFRDCF